SLPALTYPTPESRLQLFEALHERLRRLPGVENVGTAMSLPFAGGGYGEKLTPEGSEPSYSDPGGRLDFVSPDYLQTLGARLLGGRWFNEADNRRDGPRVAIINEQVMQRLYGGEMPVGRQLRVSGNRYEIIGVIQSLPDRNKDAPSPLFVYAPLALDPSAHSVVLRTRLQPETLVPQVQEALRAVDAGLPMANVRTLDQAMKGSLELRRLVLVLVGVFAGAALVLACVGLYGVMAYSVATRQRELSIRLALGAVRADIVRLVLRDGGKMILGGVGLGLILSLISTGFLRMQLYGVSARDPLVLGLSVAVLGGVAILACWWPAVRAARADALAALRAE
ncbi:MAG TPA: ABC transporter permease, partial [Candidatus Synoicihabitans sp.]|nr:ABC transporter permease [Candidatus Synoicihabitans sp.]